ncbi:MAG: radical SAM protein [Bacteroidales bacterium]|nr:radical SAM protein [Bacteroidales bacterium]
MAERTTDRVGAAPFIGILRHRIGVDGQGVTTLAAFHGCPLRCRYCLNPQSTREGTKVEMLTSEELVERVRVDDLYFKATGGGVTFGGGEPGLRAGFIESFREIADKEWKINIETSLNIDRESVETLLRVADTIVVDIKDMDGEVYRAYTGRENRRVVENLKYIAERGMQGRCVVRVPKIEGYNTEEWQRRSVEELREMGYGELDVFEYKVLL